MVFIFDYTFRRYKKQNDKAFKIGIIFSFENKNLPKKKRRLNNNNDKGR